MKKLLIASLVVSSVLSSTTVFAATVDQSKNINTKVAFGATTTFDGTITPVMGLPAGTTADNTTIATVSVVNPGSSWLISNDPNDTTNVSKAPDKGWVMKSVSDPTKTVKVRLSNDDRLDYQGGLGGRNWNRMPPTAVAKIVTDTSQNIAAGDDYDLTVTIARYLP
ncbi:hypothetical protein L2C91_13795 [Rosenbergiella epipactidis]|uniref:hypothetical protein n=1 Tax=Rosenbergiella epipactidis TaxID=1544694 RepID=UPI0020275CD8|nr:hypothetical protein [Rosenbergiella epipactidis]MCL9669437.1 hypothetical protein [Rosenbergiella epipactidis]